jgi:hypothetical protein
VALIEFALVFPLFFVLIFGGVEVTRLILIQQKLEKAGYALSDIVTQYQPATVLLAAGEISVANMNTNVFPQLDRMLSPYNDSTRSAVIVTSVERLNDALFVRWQIAGGGSLSGGEVKSIVNGLSPAGISGAVAGTTPSFPAEQAAAIAGYVPTVGNSANFIVTEVFYRYDPILQTVLQGVGGSIGFNFSLQSRVYVKRVYFVPRYGSLLALPSTFPVP